MIAELPNASQPPFASALRSFGQRGAVLRTADIPGDIAFDSGLLLKMQRNTLLCNALMAAIPKSDIDSDCLKPRIHLNENPFRESSVQERLEDTMRHCANSDCRDRRSESAAIVVLMLFMVVISAAAQQIKTGEEYALQLQRMYQRNGYDVAVTFHKEENTLALRADEFRDSGTREAVVRELTRDAKTMCGSRNLVCESWL